MRPISNDVNISHINNERVDGTLILESSSVWLTALFLIFSSSGSKPLHGIKAVAVMAAPILGPRSIISLYVLLVSLTVSLISFLLLYRSFFPIASFKSSMVTALPLTVSSLAGLLQQILMVFGLYTLAISLIVLLQQILLILSCVFYSVTHLAFKMILQPLNLGRCLLKLCFGNRVAIFAASFSRSFVAEHLLSVTSQTPQFYSSRFLEKHIHAIKFLEKQIHAIKDFLLPARLDPKTISSPLEFIYKFLRISGRFEGVHVSRFYCWSSAVFFEVLIPRRLKMQSSISYFKIYRSSVEEDPSLSDRRISSKSPMQSPIKNAVDSGFQAEIEKYRAEIQRLHASEAAIKALSVDYAAVLKDTEEQLSRLQEEMALQQWIPGFLLQDPEELLKPINDIKALTARQHTAGPHAQKLVEIWLCGSVTCGFSMVVLGGVTRSGLSMIDCLTFIHLKISNLIFIHSSQI